MRLADLLLEIGMTVPPGIEMSDALLGVRCANCGQLSSLADLERKEVGDQTEYVCPCGATPVVIDSISPEIASTHRIRFLHGEAERPHVAAFAGTLWLRIPGGEPMELPDSAV